MSTIYHSSRGPAQDVLRPDPALIDLRAMAIQLAGMPRYNNDTPQKQTIGYHSLLVARILPFELRACGLLHDFHETILSDVPRPVKTALRSLCEVHIGNRMPDFDPYEMLTRIWDKAIYEAAGIKWPLSEEAIKKIKWADDTILATEVRDLFEDASGFEGLPKPAKFTVDYQSEDDVADGLVFALEKYGILKPHEFIATPHAPNKTMLRAFS